MNTPPTTTPTIWDRSPISRFCRSFFTSQNHILRLLRWAFSARVMGRVAFTLVTVATLIALFYAEERWRGKHAWEQYKAEKVAQGAKFDLASFIPPPVPDAQNFAMTPFLAPMYDFLPGTQTWRDTNAMKNIYARNDSLNILSKTRGFDLGMGTTGKWDTGELTDLIALLGTNRTDTGKVAESTTNAIPRPITQEQAATIILNLFKETYDPIIDELRTASHRPYSRFNIKYDYESIPAILLPHLATIKLNVIKLCWRAKAEMALGKTNEAYEDLRLGFYLVDSAKDEPFLISHLVRIASHTLVIRVIWEGISAHQWSDSQLQRFQTILTGFDFMSDIQRTVVAERTLFGVVNIQNIINSSAPRDPLEFMMDYPLKESFSLIALRYVWPRGWFYFEMISICKESDQCVARYDQWKRGDSDTKSFFQALDKAGLATQKMGFWEVFSQHRFLCAFLPAVLESYHKAASSQTCNNLALAACAAERSYLARGSYPETLDALAPTYLQKLPVDVMSGKPLIYRRESPSSYTLYSVGENFVDDGGTVALHKDKNVDHKTGDMVWRIPGKLKANAAR